MSGSNRINELASSLQTLSMVVVYSSESFCTQLQQQTNLPQQLQQTNLPQQLQIATANNCQLLHHGSSQKEIEKLF